MNEINLIQLISISALPAIFAITVHEAAHGYAARHFGDRTAEMEGRLSLNPLKHIDLVGTVLVPALTLWVSQFLFGWAKPVPVDYRNLKHPKRDMLWIAAAGPASNLAMAICWALLLQLATGMDAEGSYRQPLSLMAYMGVLINVSLMVLNLIPLPPLDGGRMLVSLLPMKAAMTVSRVEPYGFFILLALMATGTLSKLMTPVTKAFMAVLT